jgi:3-deoxy-D-manno-octulosonate 8-phosphate phosphatase (KDO 8-P phosphatase)
MKGIEKAKLLILDVDGVLTDGRIIYDNLGNELKAFNVKDGLGLVLLKKLGFKIAIITGRKSEIVEKRSRELKIDFVYQSVRDKLEAFNDLKNKTGLSEEDTIYIGDDYPDLPIMLKVKYPITVPSAPDLLKEIAVYTTKKDGGEGAVREVVDIILDKKDIKRVEQILLLLKRE